MPGSTLLPSVPRQSAILAVQAMGITLVSGYLLFILSVFLRPIIQSYLIRRYYVRRMASALPIATPAHADVATMTGVGTGQDSPAPLDVDENASSVNDDSPQHGRALLELLPVARPEHDGDGEILEVPSPGRRQAWSS